MHFNFYLANHSGNSFVLLEDVVRPIVVGLQENGHHVATFGTTMVMAPAVNVFVEFFRDGQLVDTLLSLKAQLKDQFLFGIVCTEDLEDPYVWQMSGAARRDNLLRLLPAADFLWPIVPAASYEKIYPRERIAYVRYGHSAKLRPVTGVTPEADRDLDVLIYGSPYKYRIPVAQRLQALGLRCDFTINTTRGMLEGWPRYLADEVLSRAKVVVDMRRGTEVRYASVTRIVAAVHTGSAVVAEAFDTSEMASVYRYTTSVPYDLIAETCLGIVASGDYVDRGVRARELFAGETSMRDNMAAAVNLPLFQPLLGG